MSKKRPSLAGPIAIVGFKILVSALVLATPVLGVWVASSLAAYRGGATWIPIVAGLLAFPMSPLAWDAFAEFRRKKRGDKRERILTFADRILLRTFVINFTLLVVLLATRPERAFTALSTRGDWMLDGQHGAFAETSRRALFKTAGALEWLYAAAHENRFEKLADKDRGRQPEPKPSELPEPIATAVPTATDTPPEPNRPPPKSESGPWPQPATLHRAVTEIPASEETSPEQVAKYLASRESDPFRRVKALHDYVADRVAYDAVALVENRIPQQDAASVFRTRKGVCAGYANLMKAMAKVTGDEIVVVVGDARTDVDEIGGGGHAWNAVKLDRKWYLLDATWDAGSVSGSTFTKKYRTDYLFTPPALFGIDHFPENSDWQLREQPLSRGDFMRQPMLTAQFFAHGFKLEKPDRSQVTVSSALEIGLGNPRGEFVLGSFAPKGQPPGGGSPCEVKRGAHVDVSCAFPSGGIYRVTLFANAQQYGTYQHIATFEAVRK